MNSGVGRLDSQDINYENESRPKKRKRKLKRNKNFKRLITWIKFILISVLAITTVILLALSPLFNISAITVEGSIHYSNDEIKSSTGIVVGNNGFKTIGSNVKNILTLRYGEAEKAILKNHPYIKSAIVSFYVPNKVKVKITERKPFAVIEFKNTNLIIDEETFVLEETNSKKIKGIPLIKGLKFESFKVGQALDIKNKLNFSDAVKLIDEIKASDSKGDPKLFDLITSIDAANRNKVSVVVDSRITTNLGNLYDLNYRIAFLRKIIFEKLSKTDRGFLDMTVENPSFKPQ